MDIFKGTGVALITPFTKENKVDYRHLTKLINHQIENGIDYLVALGLTGEVVTLSSAEKENIRRHFVSITNSRVPLVVGMASNNTAQIISELEQTDFSGFDAVLSVSPWYNKPSQEGIYQHFKSVSKASPLPVIMYNVPSRTGSNLLPETVARLANKFGNLIGLKEATGSMEQVLQLIKKTPNNFLIISRDDMLALPLIVAGGAGVISVIGQSFPKDFSNMIRLGLEGKSEEAFLIHYKLMPAIDLIFNEGNPKGIKALLNKQGFCENEIRLPLVRTTNELQDQIMNFVQNF